MQADRVTSSTRYRNVGRRTARRPATLARSLTKMREQESFSRMKAVTEDNLPGEAVAVMETESMIPKNTIKLPRA